MTADRQRTLLVSACLLGERCRYDGGHCLRPEIAALAKHYRLIPVCPEQMGGLPTPRPPCERSGKDVFTRDGVDVTAPFARGCALAVQRAIDARVCAAILKQKSPTCGCGLIYDGTFTGQLVPGNGMLAEILLARGIPVISDDAIAENGRDPAQLLRQLPP